MKPATGGRGSNQYASKGTPVAATRPLTEAGQQASVSQVESGALRTGSFAGDPATVPTSVMIGGLADAYSDFIEAHTSGHMTRADMEGAALKLARAEDAIYQKYPSVVGAKLNNAMEFAAQMEVSPTLRDLVGDDNTPEHRLGAQYAELVGMLGEDNVPVDADRLSNLLFEIERSEASCGVDAPESYVTPGTGVPLTTRLAALEAAFYNVSSPDSDEAQAILAETNRVRSQMNGEVLQRMS